MIYGFLLLFHRVSDSPYFSSSYPQHHPLPPSPLTCSSYYLHTPLYSLVSSLCLSNTERAFLVNSRGGVVRGVDEGVQGAQQYRTPKIYYFENFTSYLKK